MAQLTLSQALMNQLNTLLDPQTMAFRARTTATTADSVLARVSRRREDRAAVHAALPSTDVEKLQRYIRDTFYALCDFKNKVIARRQSIGAHEVLRVLYTIEVALSVVFGAHDKTNLLSNVWTTMFPNDAVQTRESIFWPTNNIQHASALSRAIVDMTKAQPWGPHLLMVKRVDLKMAAGAAFLLTHSIRDHHSSLGYAVPAAQPYDHGAANFATMAERERARHAPGAQA